MQITLEQAVNLLNQADAVILDEEHLIFVHPSDVTGDFDAEFLSIEFYDVDGGERIWDFNEGANHTPDFTDGVLTLLDELYTATKFNLLYKDPTKKLLTH